MFFLDNSLRFRLALRTSFPPWGVFLGCRLGRWWYRLLALYLALAGIFVFYNDFFRPRSPFWTALILHYYLFPPTPSLWTSGPFLRRALGAAGPFLRYTLPPDFPLRTTVSISITSSRVLLLLRCTVLLPFLPLRSVTATSRFGCCRGTGVPATLAVIFRSH